MEKGNSIDYYFSQLNMFIMEKLGDADSQETCNDYIYQIFGWKFNLLKYGSWLYNNILYLLVIIVLSIGIWQYELQLKDDNLKSLLYIFSAFFITVSFILLSMNFFKYDANWYKSQWYSMMSMMGISVIMVYFGFLIQFLQKFNSFSNMKNTDIIIFVIFTSAFMFLTYNFVGNVVIG